MGMLQNTVETVLSVVDKASQPYTMAASAAEKLRASVQGALPMVVQFGAALGAAALVRGIMAVNSSFESTRLSIAGTLRAYDLVGESMTDINRRYAAGTDEWRAHQHAAFEDATTVAENAMARINTMAAALPGTAEDYVQVFRTALPAALAAGMSDINEITTMTSNFAATAIANQVDAEQAGRDMAMILRGHAGANVRTWTVLQGLIGKTAQQFNQLTATERVRTVQGALAKYGPLMDEFSTSWEAVQGTTEAVATNIFRTASRPIFNEIKAQVMGMNSSLMDANGNLIGFAAIAVDVGTRISTSIAGGLRHAVEFAKNLRDTMVSIGDRVQTSPWWTDMQESIYDTVDEMRSNRASGGGAAGAAGSVAGVALGGVGALAIGSLTAFATHTEQLVQTITSLTQVGSSAVELFMRVSGALNNFYGDMGNLLSGILPGLTGGLATLAGYVQVYYDRLIDTVDQGVGRVMAALQPIANALGPLFDKLGGAAGRLFTIFSEYGLAKVRTFFSVVGFLAEKVSPYVAKFVDALTSGVTWVNNFLDVVLEASGAVGDLLMPYVTMAGNAIQWAFGQLVPYWESAKTAVGDFVNNIPAYISSAWEHMQKFAGDVVTFVTTLPARMQTLIASAANAAHKMLGSLFTPVAAFFDRAISIFRTTFNTLYSVFNWVGTQIRTVIQALISAMQRIPFMSRFLAGAGSFSFRTAAQFLQTTGGSVVDAVRQRMEERRNAVAQQRAAEEQRREIATNRRAADRAAAHGRTRGGHQTYNDFRGSRFDITQKFAQGFDPDRVGIAMLSELERAATQTLQSGFEPAFTVR